MYMNIFAKQDKLQKLAPGIISGLFVLASIYTLYASYDRLSGGGHADSTEISSPGDKQGGEIIAPATIASWHLFGQSSATASVNQPSPVSAPDTQLNLKLYGVIASDGQYDAGAIIEDGKGTQKYFSIGDNIQSGIKLKEIYPDRVIIDRSGRLETLRLPEQSIKLGISDAPDDKRINPVIPKPGQQKSLMELRERLLKQQKKLHNTIPTEE